MFFCTLFPVVVSAVALLMDLRSAKVDNGWICFSMAIGFGIQIWKKGAAGIWDFAAGSSLPIMVLGGLFFFHMIGAGDIKLFCALGSVWGPRTVWKCILMSLFLGAGISAAILISEGNFSQRFHYFIRYIEESVKTGEIMPYSGLNILSPESFHFTVPVFLSTALYAGGVY